MCVLESVCTCAAVTVKLCPEGRTEHSRMKRKERKKERKGAWSCHYHPLHNEAIVACPALTVWALLQVHKNPSALIILKEHIYLVQ